MKGYKRADGRIGIRNHVAVIYTVECARHVAENISSGVPGTEVFGYGGCYHDPYAYKMLVELGKHPNVAAVLVVGLGCESTDKKSLINEIEKSGKDVVLINIQETGGTVKTIEHGREIAKKMVAKAESMERVECSIHDLIIGVECGGSDATSGLSANPATGWAVDRLIEKRATVIFSEIPELLGSDEYLLDRAINQEVQSKIKSGLARAKRLGNRLNTFAVSVGNEEGGLTTIEEKSLGALAKAGTKPISNVIKTGERPLTPGLYLLDKIGDVETNQLTIYEESDNDGLISLIASGAQLLIFTTGRGNVIGSVISPVIKVCGNPITYRNMSDDMDINAGDIIEGQRTIKKVGENLEELIYEVVNGELTKAENLGHKEYHIPDKPGRACDVL